MAEFRIDPRIFERFPDVLVGVLVVHGLDNHNIAPENVEQLQLAAQQLQAQLAASTPISEHPHIAPWREAYRLFGAKPKKYPSSIENLMTRIAKGSPPMSINKLVDIYNLVSISHLVPAGGEDLDRIQGDVVLTFASEDEAEVVLLGESEARAPHAGEVIYRDDIGAICRRWNWKEADRTKLNEATTNAVLVIEALPPVTYDELQAAVDELVALIRQHCGGELRSQILTPAQPSILL
jgi:DNA/RNA-binding domain of Phe-tRNA-synthetase-like protein